MSGFGIAPFGLAPYGLGTPATSASKTGPVLPDSTGSSQGSRFVHPQTRRYVFDSTGRAIGTPNVPSLVQLALSTTLGSSAMPSLGDPVPGGVIGANFDAKRKSAISAALKSLVDQKLISIIEVSVNSKTRPVQILVRWTDLTTSLEQETKV